MPKTVILRKSLMTRDYIAGLAVGLVGVAMAMLRIKNGEQDVLIRLLNPGELFALVRNPELAQHGFPSGADTTAHSLPLHLYQLLAYSPIDLELAFRVVSFTEIVFFAVCIWCAVAVIDPAARTTVAGIVVLIGLQGTILSHNLAHFGFMFGWNYGFATGVLLLVLGFGLRGKWPQAVMAIAVLLTIHPTLAVHGVLALCPIAIYERIWKNRNIVFPRVILVITFCTTYILLSRGKQDLSTAYLNSELYLRLVRVFNYHLFYDFDLRFLALLIKDFAGWSVALGVLVYAIASWCESRTSNLPNSVQYQSLGQVHVQEMCLRTDCTLKSFQSKSIRSPSE